MKPGLLSRLFGRRRPPAIPDAAWNATLARLPFLDWLADTDRRQLKTLAERFLAEKEFSAAGGLALDDAMCLTIAAQGCLPVLRLGLDYYDDWVGIVVYPDEFVIPRSIVDDDGVLHEYDEVASGEAWGGGPLLVSWRDVEMAGDGYNVVIHEFAHKLDMRNGDADGTPPLHGGLTRAQWESTLLAAHDAFCDALDACERSGGEPPFDPYAAENPAEFFAVMSEAFFETPRRVRAHYPALYDQFSVFYRLDPAAHDAGK